MDILPPRRRGQLGAISVGAPITQSFSIQASSKAQSKANPAQLTLPPVKGSVANRPPLSISEQVAEMRKAAAAKATAQSAPKGQADGYGKAPTALVQGFQPPKNTPPITQPPRQPNEDARVPLLARQIPQNKQQVIQQVLAKDAGIVVPATGPAPVIPAKPEIPGGSIIGPTLADDEQELANVVYQMTTKPIPPIVAKWASLRGRQATTDELRNIIGKVLSDVPLTGIADSDYKLKLEKIMRRWLDVLDERAKSRQQKPVQDVNATTSSSIPKPDRFVSPPPPPVTKEGLEAAQKASQEGVKADLAKQDAVTKEVTAESIREALNKITGLAKTLSISASMAREVAKQKAQQLAEAKAKAAAVLTSQTSSEDAKSDAEAMLRGASESKALAEKQANEAGAKEKEALAEKAKLEQALAQMEKAAKSAKQDARNKEERAAAAEKQVVKAEEKALMRAAVLPPRDMPGMVRKPESIQGLGAAPEGGVSVTTILFGLVAVGAVVYALDAKKQNLSGSPTLIESLE